MLLLLFPCSFNGNVVQIEYYERTNYDRFFNKKQFTFSLHIMKWSQRSKMILKNVSFDKIRKLENEFAQKYSPPSTWGLSAIFSRSIRVNLSWIWIFVALRNFNILTILGLLVSNPRFFRAVILVGVEQFSSNPVFFKTRVVRECSVKERADWKKKEKTSSPVYAHLPFTFWRRLGTSHVK